MRALRKRIQQGAHAIADFQARVILTVLYGLFVVPVGLVQRWIEDTLQLNIFGKQPTYWRKRRQEAIDLRTSRRQG